MYLPSSFECPFFPPRKLQPPWINFNQTQQEEHPCECPLPLTPHKPAVSCAHPQQHGQQVESSVILRLQKQALSLPERSSPRSGSGSDRALLSLCHTGTILYLTIQIFLLRLLKQSSDHLLAFIRKSRVSYLPSSSTKRTVRHEQLPPQKDLTGSMVPSLTLTIPVSPSRSHFRLKQNYFCNY